MTVNTDIHTVVPVPLEQGDITPFGEAISLSLTPKLPIDLYQGKNAVHGPVVLESDQTPEFIMFKVGLRGGDVRYLERHVGMTQTFIPLGGDPYVLVVAAPDAPLVDGFPDFDAVHAFLVPGDVVVNIHRGTWHEPPFPTREGQVFLISSQPDVTKGLQTTTDQNGEVHLLDVDKRNPLYRTGRRIQVELPQ